MGAFPLSRLFRLSVEGVRCDENGLFVGGAPMLAPSPRPDGGLAWAARPAEDQNRDLGARYGSPVDAAAKRGGFGAIARSLERGVPDYIEVDHAKGTAKMTRIPGLSEVPYPTHMEPNLVIEFYSRCAKAGPVSSTTSKTKTTRICRTPSSAKSGTSCGS